MRRAIEIVGTGGVLELSVAISPKIKKRLLYLEETLDGTYRLVYNADMIPDFSKVTQLTFANMAGKKLSGATVTVEGLNLVLPLAKASAIDTPLKAIQLEEMKDGTWLMLYSRALIPDLASLSALKVIRED